MAGGSLLALLDDIATVLDDVSVMTKMAAKKTSGVLGDDLALNAQQVAGVLLAVARPYTAPRSWQRVLLTLLVITVVLGLAFHLLPGFNNLRWMPPEAAGPHSPPYSFWLNADKALLPFVLIIIIPQLFVTAPLRRVTRLHWLLLAFSVPALLLLATVPGGLGFEPHLPRWLPAFMLANLFFISPESSGSSCISARARVDFPLPLVPIKA